MKQVKIDENGNLVDIVTGQVLGKRSKDGVVKYEQPDNNPAATQEKTQQNTGQQSPPKPSFTKYDIRPDSEFTVHFCIGEKDGRIIVCDSNAYLSMPGLEQHWATFRMWTFKEQLQWKEKCTDVDMKTRCFVTNQDKFNEIKLRNLLKAWSFGDMNFKYRLLHVNGYLADESYSVIEAMYPTIMNSLLYLMNQVLDGNC